MATLLLAGFGWTLPLRRSAFIHDFKALFYMGIPLVFVFSAFQMSHVGHDAEAAEFHPL